MSFLRPRRQGGLKRFAALTPGHPESRTVLASAGKRLSVFEEVSSGHDDCAAGPANRKGGEGQEPEVTRPAHSAAKAEWVGYAVRAHGMTPDDAEALTKADLIERFGGTS